MSEYTREEILKLIEENGGPEELDLSGKDLSGIDLSMEAITAELEKARERAPDETPAWYSSLTEGINLGGANLQGTILWGANLRGADLCGANLQQTSLLNADIREAILWGANLSGAYLGGADLQGVLLSDADLHGAVLGSTDLTKAIPNEVEFLKTFGLPVDLLEGILRLPGMEGLVLAYTDSEPIDFKARILSARFQWGANLTGVHLENTRSIEGIYLYQTVLNKTNLVKEQLETGIGEEKDGQYYEAKEAYLALKNNFNQIGRYEDAAWAYRKERRMEKLAAFQRAKEAWQEHDWKVAIPRYAKVVGDQLVEWVCDYGEGLGRVAGSLIAVWVCFALIYGLIAGVWGPWQDTGSGKIRYITRNPIDLLSFSLGAMTTLEPIGLKARPILAMRILAPLEALLGIFLAGLLGFVAGKRIRRS